MYDARTLKPTLHVSADEVECPVLGCAVRVPRQRGHVRRDAMFRCVEHEIYISASTHDHESAASNLLTPDAENLALLARLVGEKRETARLGRERSEDALTFNVFRALERAGALDAVMSDVAGRQVRRSLPAFWSLQSTTGRPERLLAAARTVFREVVDRGTEPDVYIESDDTLFLIEAKLGASNATTPTHVRSLDSYASAADGWYARTFASGPEVVAVQEQRYQLMRLWLLGTWMAAQVDKQFVLVSLCTDASDTGIETSFGAHIVQNELRRFKRYTWEAIREACRTGEGVASLAPLVAYLDHRTSGYASTGQLQMALKPWETP